MLDDITVLDFTQATKSQSLLYANKGTTILHELMHFVSQQQKMPEFKKISDEYDANVKKAHKVGYEWIVDVDLCSFWSEVISELLD